MAEAHFLQISPHLWVTLINMRSSIASAWYKKLPNVLRTANTAPSHARPIQ